MTRQTGLLLCAWFAQCSAYSGRSIAPRARRLVARSSASASFNARPMSAVERATRPDLTLDPHVLALEATYEPLPTARVWGVAYFSAMATAACADVLPAFARLLVIQYLVFSAFEYCFHRWCMHAKSGTLRDKLFKRWNRLHVQHHVDTHDDMRMEEGYNWRGIRFNYATSKIAVLIGTAVSLGACSALRLGLPRWPTPIAASIVSVYHGVLWNRLHTDSHGLQRELTWDDGLPYVEKVPVANRYARWLLTNHIGHHAIKGTGNYNIVFPGPDLLAGTYYRLANDQDAQRA